jgi:hypothetical protein
MVDVLSKDSDPVLENHQHNQSQILEHQILTCHPNPDWFHDHAGCSTYTLTVDDLRCSKTRAEICEPSNEIVPNQAVDIPSTLFNRRSLFALDRQTAY